jgi:hypothetical protein
MSLGDARVTQITKSAVERRKAIANQVKKTRLPPAILVK